MSIVGIEITDSALEDVVGHGIDYFLLMEIMDYRRMGYGGKGGDGVGGGGNWGVVEKWGGLCWFD